MNDYIDLEDYDEIEEEPYSLERDEGAGKVLFLHKWRINLKSRHITV